MVTLGVSSWHHWILNSLDKRLKIWNSQKSQKCLSIPMLLPKKKKNDAKKKKKVHATVRFFSIFFLFRKHLHSKKEKKRQVPQDSLWGMTFKMIPGASDAIPKAGLRFRIGSPEDVGDGMGITRGWIWPKRWFQLSNQIFVIFTPKIGENDPIWLISYFFRWVVQFTHQVWKK